MSLPSPRRGGSPPGTRRGHPPQRVRWRRGEIRLHRAAALLALLLALLPAIVAADEMDDRVREIAKQLRCPVCAGESVADSNAQVSVQMRGIIREKLEAGESEAQIKAYFVERYGESVLLSPAASGFTLGVWVAPLIALLIGLAIVATVLRSWSRRGVATSPAARPPAPGTLRPDDDERLERELARFQRTRGKVRG